ncbi:hypothetical protein N7488_010493 [Penicillium malachiteum]|nr:hypothetical protein N7488_010493 [Penicillium malachiteum]
MSGEVKCVDEGDRALVMRFATQRATALRHNDAMLNLRNNDDEDERIGSSLNGGSPQCPPHATTIEITRSATPVRRNSRWMIRSPTPQLST